jgi:predicted AAA+ superfamily ATPase
MSYIPRAAERTLKRFLRTFPVVGLTGPRQSGKSTMLKKLLGQKYRYVTFDDLNNVARFHDDPEQFMEVFADKVIFDEVQRVPELFSYVKLRVDNDRSKYGKFVMTGSSQFAFLKRVSESLAGRIGLLTLLPFQRSEIPQHLREQSLYEGGYPELVTRKYRESFVWYTSYLDTYLTKDVRDLREIGDIRDFRRFVQLLAARVAQILNMSEIARDLGVTVATVKKWISVLEASYVVFLLPPYYNNLGKRVVKSPKVYFVDTGLVSYLTGIRTKELYEQGPLHGALFENYVISEIYKRELHARSNAELFYFRESNGHEIDLIIDRKTDQQFIEIKSSYTYRPDMTRSLKTLKKKDAQGILLYRGKTLESTRDLQIQNYTSFLEADAQRSEHGSV